MAGDGMSIDSTNLNPLLSLLLCIYKRVPILDRVSAEVEDFPQREEGAPWYR